MSDLISRQAAIDVLGKMQTYKLFAGDDMLLIDQAEAQTELMMLPSVQPDLSSYSDKLWRNAYKRGRTEAEAEIVRCKDCKWKQGAECVRFAEIRVFPNDFCSRAERREE